MTPTTPEGTPTDTPTPTTPTETPTDLPTATPTTPAACVGDCASTGSVTAADLITAVNIALGTESPSACTTADRNHDGQVTVDEITDAVDNALVGCP